MPSIPIERQMTFHNYIDSSLPKGGETTCARADQDKEQIRNGSNDTSSDYDCNRTQCPRVDSAI